LEVAESSAPLEVVIREWPGSDFSSAIKPMRRRRRGRPVDKGSHAAKAVVTYHRSIVGWTTLISVDPRRDIVEYLTSSVR